MWIREKLKRFDRNIIAIFVVSIFNLLHQALYKWGLVQPKLLLTVQTVMTLVFAWLLRNVFILITSKISFSWTIHPSFNMNFFPGFWINNTAEKFTCEPERFNIVFENSKMVVITGLLATISLTKDNS